MRPRRRVSNTVLLSLVFLLAAGSVSQGQDIGSFFVGVNRGLNDLELQNNFTTYKVDDLGVSVGFVLAVYVRTWGLHYKGRVAFHGVEDLRFGADPSPDDERFYRNMGQYISSLNEVMVGRRFDLGSTAYVHPLLGFGVLVNIIYGNSGEGIAHGSFQFDLSTQIMYRLGGFDLGAQVSFEYVAWDGYFTPTNVRYVTLAAVIAK
jgi:hypothetical protein